MELTLPAPGTRSRAEFLPHSGPLLFVDRVLGVDLDGKEGEFSFVVGQGKAYLDENEHFDETWFIEALSQAAGALFYHQSGGNGRPKTGFLVGIEHFEVLGTRPLPIGEVIRLKARMMIDFHPFGVYECEAFVAGKTVARGEFKFFVEEGEERG